LRPLLQERATRLTPKLFLHKMVEAAKAARQHIVLPEGNDHRILAAACDLLRNDVCQLTILGKRVF
jgi:phosphate acetyltransferase